MMEKEKVIQLIDNNVAGIEELVGQKVHIWRSFVLFSSLWWLGLGLSILPWIIWFVYRKRGSTARLMLAGFYVIIVSLTLDVLGDQFGLWHYRFNVIPVLPTYLPWELTLMPVAVMFLLQFKPSANPYLKALIFALLTAYGAEPFFEWLAIYTTVRWKFTYSVPFQFLIFVTAYYLSRANSFDKLVKTG